MDIVESSSRIVSALTGSYQDEQNRPSRQGGDSTQMIFAASQLTRPQTPLSFTQLQAPWTHSLPPLAPFAQPSSFRSSQHDNMPLAPPADGRNASQLAAEVVQLLQPMINAQTEQIEKRIAEQSAQITAQSLALRDELHKEMDTRDEAMKKFVMDYVAQNMPTENTSGNIMVENINKQMRKQRYQMDQAEQNSRGDNFIIKGIHEDNSEDLQQKVIDIVKKTDVTLDPTEIKAHFRMGNRTSSGRFPRPIMVQINNRDKRTKIMIGKKKLGTGQFIEEDLTKLRSKMHYAIRKNVNTSKTWTINGDIFAVVKGRNGLESKEQFSTPEDLYKLGWNKDKLDEFLGSQ